MDDRDYEHGRRRGPIVAGHPDREPTERGHAGTYDGSTMAAVIRVPTPRATDARKAIVTVSIRAMAMAAQPEAAMPATLRAASIGPTILSSGAATPELPTPISTPSGQRRKKRTGLLRRAAR